MDNWNKVKLGQFVDSISNTHKLNSPKIVLVNTSDVYDGKVLNHYAVNNTNLRGQFKKTFKEGDILYSEIRPQNRRFAFIDFNSENYVASTKLMVLRRSSEKIDNNYLYQLLKSDNIIKQLQSLAESRSGTFPQITFNILSNLEINLPPLPTQRRIAGILSALDDKIENNRKTSETLEQIAQAIFKRWFVDFEFPDAQGRPYKSSGGKLQYAEEDKTYFPNEWIFKNIGNISEIQNGFAFKAPEYVDNGIKVLRTLNIGSSGHFENSNIVFLPNSYNCDKYKKYLLRTYDVALVMVGASVGKIGIVFGNTAGSLQNQNMWRFRSKYNGLSQAYIYFTVKELQKKTSNWTTGSARGFYRKDSFSKIKIPIPDYHILNSFNKIVMPLFENINNKVIENEILTQTRDTLLPKLMSGEVEV